MNNNKILIVEDEKSLADVLKIKLQKEGYETHVSYDGLEGYKEIIQMKPDLILLDIIMPKMNGYEVLEKMNKEGIKIPVIIISNSGQPVEIEKTKKLGAIGHLIKAQFEPEEVIEKVKNFLGKGKNSQNNKMEYEPAINPAENFNNSAKSGVKILLVEDDSFLREILTKKLIKEGFTVFESIDGEQALKEVEKIKPDIVLLDIIIPSLNGFEVLAWIKKNLDEKIRNISVIMLSNLGQENDIKKALEMGADSFIIKANFTTEEIAEKIKKIRNK